MPETTYSDKFYDAIRDGSRRSAQAVAPIAIELVRPKSIVDVGCGDGTWLAVFRDLGVIDTVGLDGDYVERRMLQIPQDQFRATDLSSPFGLPRTFDLAISLEVAEHLPPLSADGFVESLTKLAPAVLFSAAIPFQGGTQHLNEQWPDYWAALFKNRDYLPVDCIRGKIWGNDQVEHWYAQNTLLFASADRIREDSKLRREHEKTNLQQLALVHPRTYASKAQPRTFQFSVRGAVRLLGEAAVNAVQRRVRSVFSGDPDAH
jgi:SAM-dependent methyltransferase